MGMLNYSTSLMESEGKDRSQSLGKLSKHSGSLTQWVRCLGGSPISAFFLAEGKRTKNSKLGFISRESKKPNELGSYSSRQHQLFLTHQGSEKHSPPQLSV